MSESNLKKDITIVLLIGIFIVAILFLQRGKMVKLKPGSPAPNFTLKSLDGENVSLSQFKGKVVLLNFWATWCSPCKEEIPELNRLYEKMKDRNFVILAVSEDNKPPEKIKDFTREYNMKFTVLYDGSRTAAGLYRLSGVPETFLIDKNGKLIYKFIGPKNWTGKEMMDIFEKLLNNQ